MSDEPEDNPTFAMAIAAHRAQGDRYLYGNQWGDPKHGTLRYVYERYLRRRKVPGDLSKVVKRYILPFVRPGMTVMEIGAGGGRWTQFLLPASEIIIVETTPEFFPYLEQRFGRRFELYQTLGSEMRGIAAARVDYAFSFGTFVHTAPEVLQGYLAELARVLRPGGIAVLQYADKTKAAARLPGPQDSGFADLNPRRFEDMSTRHGFVIRSHDTRLLNHSNIAVLVRP